MSPQLNLMTYGYQQHDFAQTAREGGWRPIVYLQHGLAVGMVMTAASVCGVWLAWTGALKRIGGMPIWVAVAAVLITNLILRATGAAFLMAAGIGVLFATRHLRTYALVIALCMAPVGYMVARAIGGWDGELAVRAAALVVGEDRAMSLEFRLINEQMLLDHASLRRMFGWGTQGGSLIKDPQGEIISVPDGLWVIAIGSMGLLGLCSFYSASLLPILLLRLRGQAGDLGCAAGRRRECPGGGGGIARDRQSLQRHVQSLLPAGDGGLTALVADRAQTLPAELPDPAQTIPTARRVSAGAPSIPAPAVPAARPARAPGAGDDDLACEHLPERPPEVCESEPPDRHTQLSHA